jgi:hypothetical protein
MLYEIWPVARSRYNGHRSKYLVYMAVRSFSHGRRSEK